MSDVLEFRLTPAALSELQADIALRRAIGKEANGPAYYYAVWCAVLLDEIDRLTRGQDVDTAGDAPERMTVEELNAGLDQLLGTGAAGQD